MTRNNSFWVLTLILCASVQTVESQSVRIAPWRYNRTGAYSIILDDYCTQYFGEMELIDSTTANRDIQVSFAVIAGYDACDPYCWRRSWGYATQRFFPKGHRFVNHSYAHDPDWPQSDSALEVDSSKAIIERELPGYKCLFFAYPYDRFNEERINLFRTREYIGTRAGTRTTNCGNADCSSLDPFKLGFKGFGSSTTVSALTGSVDEVISKRSWNVMEGHNVGSGNLPISADRWVALLDYAKQKVDQGELWVGVVQDVLMYAMERRHYTVSITDQTATTLAIQFVTDRSEINPSPVVQNSLYDYPLTLLVALNGFTVAEVLQSGASIPFEVRGDTLQFDAEPYGGPVTVSSTVSVQPLVRTATAKGWVRVERGRQPRLVVTHEGRYTIDVYGLSGMLLERFDVDGAGEYELLPQHARGACVVKVHKRDTREAVVLPLVAR